MNKFVFKLNVCIIKRFRQLLPMDMSIIRINWLHILSVQYCTSIIIISLCLNCLLKLASITFKTEKEKRRKLFRVLKTEPLYKILEKQEWLYLSNSSYITYKWCISCSKDLMEYWNIERYSALHPLFESVNPIDNLWIYLYI